MEHKWTYEHNMASLQIDCMRFLHQFKPCKIEHFWKTVGKVVFSENNKTYQAYRVAKDDELMQNDYIKIGQPYKKLTTAQNKILAYYKIK